MPLPRKVPIILWVVCFGWLGFRVCAFQMNSHFIYIQRRPTLLMAKCKYEEPFSLRLPRLQDDGEFSRYLKLQAQRKKLLSPSDRVVLTNILKSRLTDMVISNLATVLWSLGSFKIPIRSKVTFKQSIC